MQTGIRGGSRRAKRLGHEELGMYTRANWVDAHERYVGRALAKKSSLIKGLGSTYLGWFIFVRKSTANEECSPTRQHHQDQGQQKEHDLD